MCSINIFTLRLDNLRDLRPWQKCLLCFVSLVVVVGSVVPAVVAIVQVAYPQGNVCIFERRLKRVDQNLNKRR